MSAIMAEPCTAIATTSAAKMGSWGRPFPIKMKKPQQLFISSFYVTKAIFKSSHSLRLNYHGLLPRLSLPPA